MTSKRFEVVEMIAQGGMAEVYRALIRNGEREVCIKKILPQFTADAAFVRMFVDEAKLASKLHAPNIVEVYDLCISEDGQYFIVMEYIQGKDLSDVIHAAKLAELRIPNELAAFWAHEVCRGLDYAHEQRTPEGQTLDIIHRDISPHNVLIAYTGQVKITDFGIAKASVASNKTAVGVLKGKFGYMSPEQAKGLLIDRRSDIFNVGILLYELLTGERCFAGESDYATLALTRDAVFDKPSKSRDDIPKTLEKIVIKALAKDPEHRFETAGEMANSLEGVLREREWTDGIFHSAAFMKRLFIDEPHQAPRDHTSVLDLASIVREVSPSFSEEVPATVLEKERLLSLPLVQAVVADVSDSEQATSEQTLETENNYVIKAPLPKISSPKISSSSGVGLYHDDKAKAAASELKRYHLPLWLILFASLNVGLIAGFFIYNIFFEKKEEVIPQASTFIPDPSYVVLWVESRPTGAEVRREGVEILGQTPLLVRIPRELGKQNFEVSHRGYSSKTKTIDFGGTEEQNEGLKKIEVQLTPLQTIDNPPGVTGTLRIFADPPVEVLIDRKSQGFAFEGTEFLVTPGKVHRVQFKKPKWPTTTSKRKYVELEDEFLPQDYRVEVNPNQTKELYLPYPE